MEQFISPRHITAVLGVGRSGTSVIARGLQALGCYLGDTENFIQPNTSNPKGYFEDLTIAAYINNAIMLQLDGRWDGLKVFADCAIHADLSDFQIKAEEVLNNKFSQASWCGFKDPRTSRLLFFWQPIFQKMQLQDNYIIALRNPSACIASLERYFQVEPLKGYLLWLAYVIPAVSQTAGKCRVVTSYENILADPVAQLKRIQEKLNMPHHPNADLEQYANEFLEQQLCHSHSSYQEFKGTALVPALCVKVYDLLLLVANDTLSTESQNFTDRWLEIEKEYQILVCNNAALYQYVDTLSTDIALLREQAIVVQQQAAALQEEKQKLQATWLWRFLHSSRPMVACMRNILKLS